MSDKLREQHLSNDESKEGTENPQNADTPPPQPMSDKKPNGEAPKDEFDSGVGSSLQPRQPDIFDDEEALPAASEIKVSLRPLAVSMKVIKKPPKGTHFQCHPDPKMRIESAGIIVDPLTKDPYFVAPNMVHHPLIVRHRKPVTITPVFMLPGDRTALWTVPILPEGRDPLQTYLVWRRAYEISSGQPVSFKREATEHRAAIEPNEKPPGPVWVTMWWDETRYQTEMEEAGGIQRVPTWLGLTLGAMLRIAFNGRIIDSDNHDQVRRLRGLYS